MLPAIGLMIAAYAAYRILTDVLRGPARYPFTALYALSIVCGIIALLVIGVCAVDLISSASSPTRP